MERRLYQRECINIESEFFNKKATNPKKQEFFGRIYDISEGGVKLIISEKESRRIALELEAGDTLCFQAIDTYELYKEMRTTIISGEVIILRKEIEANEIIFGCKFNTISNEIKQYIENKKIASYINAGFQLMI